MPKKSNSPRRSAAKPAKSVKARAASPKKASTRATAKARPTARSPKSRASSASGKPSRSKRRTTGAHDYVATLTAGARQLGLGVRRGASLAGQRIRRIEFKRVAEFCKKEWHDLATLAGKLQQLVDHPKQPTSRRTKRTSTH